MCEREKDNKMKYYKIIWDNGICINIMNTIYTSFNAVIDDGLYALFCWAIERAEDWNMDKEIESFNLDPNRINEWDYMIDNCSVWVIEVDEEGNAIEDEYGNNIEYWISDENLKKIGRIYWDEYLKIKGDK